MRVVPLPWLPRSSRLVLVRSRRAAAAREAEDEQIGAGEAQGAGNRRSQLLDRVSPGEEQRDAVAGQPAVDDQREQILLLGRLPCRQPAPQIGVYLLQLAVLGANGRDIQLQAPERRLLPFRAAQRDADHDAHREGQEHAHEAGQMVAQVHHPRPTFRSHSSTPSRVTASQRWNAGAWTAIASTGRPALNARSSRWRVEKAGWYRRLTP